MHVDLTRLDVDIPTVSAIAPGFSYPLSLGLREVKYFRQAK